MFGAFKQIEDHCRLPANWRQAQVVAAHARAGSCLQVAPDGVVVDHQRLDVFTWRTTRAAAAALATLVLLAGGGAIGEQFVQAFTVPLVAPEQAGEGKQQVEQQAPGAGHSVQVPVEGAALFRPVQGQPGPPVQRFAWPTQVQAGETEENQHQGTGTGDLPAAITHGQEAVQLQHQVEKALTGYLALQLTGVRVGIAQQTATLARRRGEENPRGPVTAGLDPEHGNLVALFGLDPAHQLRHRQ
ncbi:hypothetical protein D3C79_708710 [compost metagenome]